MISSATFDPDSSWAERQGFLLGLALFKSFWKICCSKANLKLSDSVTPPRLKDHVKKKKNIIFVIHIDFLFLDSEYTFFFLFSSFCLVTVRAKSLLFVYFFKKPTIWRWSCMFNDRNWNLIFWGFDKTRRIKKTIGFKYFNKELEIDFRSVRFLRYHTLGAGEASTLVLGSSKYCCNLNNP